MKLVLGIEYKGTAYSGWQFQGHSTRTVQYHVQKALGFVANQEIIVHASGRTDSGVHGLEQICHFETDVVRSEFSWRQGANTQLPKDIRVKWVKPVDERFHSRYKALFRDYIYIIHQSSVPSAICGDAVAQCRYDLDIDSMALGLSYLRGEHDFSSFRAAGCQAAHPIRRILETGVWCNGPFIGIAIRGNAFLHHMVRNIVGTLIQVGRGQKQADWVQQLLVLRDRALAAPTASAQGLYFRATHYSPHWEIPSNMTTPFALFDQYQAQWPVEYPSIDFGDRLL